MLKTIVAFLQKNYKTVAIAITVLIFLLTFQECNKLKRQLKDEHATAHFQDSLSNSKITYYKDALGKEHATAENVTVASSESIKLLTDSIQKLTKGKIKGSEITAINKTTETIKADVVLQTDTVTKKIPCNGDSAVVVSSFKIHYHNPWINIEGVVGTGNDSLHISATDTLNRVDYAKKKWFLGSTHYYSDFSNTNPYVETTGYKGIALKESTKYQWSVGPMIGYGYGFNSLNLGKPVVIVGVSVQYSLIRF